MATYLTKKVLTELQEILKANKLKPVSTINDLQSAAEATKDVYTDVALETVLYRLENNSSGREGYIRTFLINVHILADCKNDMLRIFDVVDALEDDILKDSGLWTTVINRDIATINFDHGETAPYRAATILVEATIRLECDK